MDRPQFLSRIVDWLRAGYPNGVPQGDYIPLVALLRRQLTDDEVAEVSAQLARGDTVAEAISKIDAGVEISKVTQELPHEADIARVRTLLEARGWPFDNAPLGPRPTPDDPAQPDDSDTPDPSNTGGTADPSGSTDTADQPESENGSDEPGTS